jgi:arginyl-tRNA synthetase
MLIHNELAARVHSAIESAQASGELPAFEIPEVLVERPRDPTHGDYATAIALQLARSARMAPLKIAKIIANHLDKPDYLSEVSVLPPGFFNFQLALGWLQQEANRILDRGDDYGRFHLGDGKKAQVECVSANPTGPITLGRIRGGVMGDMLARALRAAGYDVTLEYYYNDAGRQITMLGEAIQIRYQQLLGQDVSLSDEHYQGEYIVDLARELIQQDGDSLLEEPVSYFSDFGVANISQQQKDSLKRINIEFDVYYREQSLYESGSVWQAVELLEKKGYVYEQEGAKWFR